MEKRRAVAAAIVDDEMWRSYGASTALGVPARL
jgi:hypothetical protein